MCSIYSIKSTVNELLDFYQAVVPPEDKDYAIPDRIYPRKLAPVVISENDQLVIKPMIYSLIPHWSKDLKKTLSYSTYNARIETVAEKATFKEPFKKKHCLVPLSEFFEPIYQGAHAGFMVRFFEKNQKLLTVAGIYDTWINPDSKESLSSFAIITDQPLPFVAAIGHQRSPIFLAENGYAEWLSDEKRDVQEIKKVLKTFHIRPDLEAQNDRALKSKQKKA